MPAPRDWLAAEWARRSPQLPALVELLVGGQLGAAGLDVFDNEPQVPAELLALDNVVLVPHNGSGTHPTRTAMGRLTLDNVAAWEAGKPAITPV